MISVEVAIGQETIHAFEQQRTTPTNITTSVSGNVLTLTWPSDHTGWRLIMQTNNLAAGISSNPTDWMTVPGSDSVNTTNITMDPALPTEFYQLVYP